MHYSFSNIPFHKELPYDKLFESTSLKEGLARMEHLKKTRGIGLIAGEAGSGKTSVIRAFTGNLNNSLYKSSISRSPPSLTTIFTLASSMAWGKSTKAKRWICSLKFRQPSSPCTKARK